MQREISDKIFLGEILNPYDDARRSTAIDRTASDYNGAKEKVQKIRDLLGTGRYDENLAKYIPGMLELAFQGMIEDVDTKEKSVHPSYKDMEQLDFQILLTENYYVNLNCIHICLPIKIKRKTNNALDIDADLITVSNFSAHWVKEKSITRYSSDKELPPTFSPWEIYQCSDGILKHLPSDSLKTINKTLLYDKQPVYYADTTYDRRNHNAAGTDLTGLNAAQQAAKKAAQAKDLDIDQRIAKFQSLLKNARIYRVPLRYFCDTGKINFPTKIDYRIKLFLETNMNKIFKSKKLLAAGVALPNADAQIIFTKAPFLQHEQILLDKNFRQYLETIMVSKKILRMGAQKTPLQTTYEINVGQDSLDVEFLGLNRQFDWLEISIVHDKSDKHASIYDSYNRELAAQTIKSLRLSNFTEIYKLTNEKRYDIDNLTQRHLLYKQFVAWNCNGSYFSVTNDDRMYLDLRATSGYVKEAEKLERNDSKINLHILLHIHS